MPRYPGESLLGQSAGNIEVSVRLSTLNDIDVLQMGQGKAAGFCAKLLADLGARVTRLVADEDKLNADGPFHPDDDNERMGGAAFYLDYGKSVVPLSSAGSDGLAMLISKASVLILDEDCVATVAGPVDPTKIYCAITPFGQTGPHAGFMASHLNLFHASCEGGAMQLPGPSWPPVQIGGEIGYFDAGCQGAVLVVAAILARRNHGRGQQIDISNQDVMVSVNRTTMLRYLHDGFDCRHNAPSYHDMMYETANGHIVIVLAMQEKVMQALARSPEGQAFNDPAFADGGWRQGRGRHKFLATLTDWCQQRSTHEAAEVLACAGLPVGAVNGPVELLASPQMRHRKFFETADHPFAGKVSLPGLPFRITPAASIAARDTRAHCSTSAEVGLPLAGLRVLDLSWAAAAPYATRIFAGLGAEVLKVEHVNRTDSARRGFAPAMHLQTEAWPYGSMEKSPNFNDLNAAKRSVSLDLQHPGARDWMDRMLPLCDIVVSNFRPGVMDKLGMGAETLLEAHPHLIVGEVSANGSTGPESKRAGYAFVFAATGGLSAQTGYVDGPPMWVPESTDFRCAAAFALGLLAALAERQRTGRGQFVDLACQEVIASFSADPLLRHALGAPMLGRMGNRHHRFAPHNAYPARGAGSWLTIAVETDREWRALCEVMERPDLFARYPDAVRRKANEVDIDHAIGQWTAFHEATELAERLQSAGVRAMPCLSNGDLGRSPHMRARSMLHEVDHAVMGRQTIVGMPWRTLPDSAASPTAGPLLGEANEYVLGHLLQAAGDEAERLGLPMA